MKQVEERMAANLAAMDPETLMSSWMPAGIQGLEQMQKMFWTQMGQSASEKPSKDDK